MGKKSVNLIICLILLLFLSPVVRATVYYVDSDTGNDNNSGTSPEQAWASLTPVNALTLAPGDQVLFKADTVYTGQLFPQGGGADGNPVIIDMYGTGNRPRIDGQGQVGSALYLYNFSYIEVSNLELTNLGPTREEGRFGVHMWANNDGQIYHNQLKNLFVHDVNGTLVKKDRDEGSGIYFESTGRTARFVGVLIEDCYVLRTDRNGISSFTGNNTRNKFYPSLNVVVRGNLVEDCGGDAIKIWGCDGALVEYNVVDGARERCLDLAAGIWPFTSDNTLIQFNEVSGVKGTGDGQAFDSDYNCYYSTFQYNYSHDNDGGFLMVCAPSPTVYHGATGTVFRYNISQNDRNRIFFISGDGVQDTYIYNNTVYVPAGYDIQMIQFGNWDGYADNTQFYNNILYVDGRVTYDMGQSTNNIFEGNVFYGDHVDPPYDPYAITDDPMLVAPGTGGWGLDSVSGYQLQSGSPCINSGVEVADNGGLDYWGNPVPTGGVTDRGAHETDEVSGYCGDETCDPGENQCNCPDDCGTPPSTETSCTDGIDNDCDLDTDCDDIDCDGDPACPDCLSKGEACTDDTECCSGNCLPNGKCQ